MAVNLITKAECKAYLGITSSNRDAEIDLLIPLVSKLVQTYCRRGITEYASSSIYTQYSDGGVDKIILHETPVLNIISFSVSTDYGVNYTALTSGTDWVLGNDGCIYAINTAKMFLPYLNGYKIEYFGGYEELPQDLKLAVLDLVEYYMKNNTAVHVNRDVTPNVTQIQYVATSNFPAHIKRVLDQYVADYT
jgi:hypothetical protein